jgi:replicative DNA helicase
MVLDASLRLTAVSNGEDRLGFRQAPGNEEAEQALLGAILVSNRAMETVADFLKADHFFNPVHGRIFDAAAKLIERGQNANPITLRAYFERDEDLMHLGGASYLADLAANVVAVVGAADYGRTIHELYLRRQLIAVGEDMVNDAHAHEMDTPATQQIECAESKLFDLGQAGEVRGGFISFTESLAKTLETAEAARKRDSHLTGVTTGFIDLNNKLGGFHRSDLLIIAARPSMGKTALVTNMALKAAKEYLDTNGKEGAVVGFFSLEMSAEQLATRILSDVTSMESEKIRKGQISDREFHSFIEASHELGRLPLFIDDTPALSIAAVRTRARRLKRKHNLGMIVIDYLQLLRADSGKASESRVLEVSEITRGLKALAKELDVPVIALSQLSRAVESREDKRPQLSDLRESGSIEQDADVVMFIYREEYYLNREEPSPHRDEAQEKFNERYQNWVERLNQVGHIAEIIIGKQRHGPIGTVKLQFDGQYTRFSDLDSHHSEHGR